VHHRGRVDQLAQEKKAAMRSFGGFGRGYWVLLQTKRGQATFGLYVCIVLVVGSALIELWAAFFAPGDTSRLPHGALWVEFVALIAAYFADRRRRKLS
jgi:hypothetical protein